MLAAKTGPLLPSFLSAQAVFSPPRRILASASSEVIVLGLGRAIGALAIPRPFPRGPVSSQQGPLPNWLPHNQQLPGRARDEHPLCRSKSYSRAAWSPADLAGDMTQRHEHANASTGLATVRDMAEPERCRWSRPTSATAAGRTPTRGSACTCTAAVRPRPGGWTDTYDITGADVPQVMDWAQRQA